MVAGRGRGVGEGGRHHLEEGGCSSLLEFHSHLHWLLCERAGGGGGLVMRGVFFTVGVSCNVTVMVALFPGVTERGTRLL